jgi:hypothetical protein
MNKKTKIVSLTILTVFLAINTGTALAQDAIQAGTLAIQPRMVFLEPTGNKIFPINFIPTSGIKKIYTILDPAVTEDTLEIYDFDENQRFSVDARMDDLTGTGNTIHYTNIGIVTLSQSPDGVDLGSFNSPPGTAHMNLSPYKCNWDPLGDTFENQCDTHMVDFPEAGITSGAISIIENTTPADIGSYSIGFGLRLTIDPNFKQDIYNGTLTFSFNLSPI